MPLGRAIGPCKARGIAPYCTHMTVHPVSLQPAPDAVPLSSVAALLGPALPAALADVALVDARQCASAAGISLSLWFELVRAGKAPQPAFRGNRCTRYRLADVRAWLVEFARTGPASVEPSSARA